MHIANYATYSEHQHDLGYRVSNWVQKIENQELNYLLLIQTFLIKFYLAVQAKKTNINQKNTTIKNRISFWTYLGTTMEKLTDF